MLGKNSAAPQPSESSDLVFSCCRPRSKTLTVLLSILSLLSDDTEIKSNIGAKHSKYGYIHVYLTHDAKVMAQNVDPYIFS